jgi:hypothetical protein
LTPATLARRPNKNEKIERGASSPVKNLTIEESSSQREEDGEANAVGGKTPAARVKVEVAPPGGAIGREEGEAATPSPP